LAHPKIETWRSTAQDAFVLHHYITDCICFGNGLHICDSAGIFIDEKGLMSIFGRR
jgi:hypothetical protein